MNQLCSHNNAWQNLQAVLLNTHGYIKDIEGIIYTMLTYYLYLALRIFKRSHQKCDGK